MPISEARRQTAHEARMRNRGYVKETKRFGRCLVCGAQDPRCLQYHHLLPEKKFMGITEMANAGYSWKKLKVEIAKCVLLCANCHDILHHCLAQGPIEVVMICLEEKYPENRDHNWAVLCGAIEKAKRGVK